jgi:hypothetical protein
MPKTDISRLCRGPGGFPGSPGALQFPRSAGAARHWWPVPCIFPGHWRGELLLSGEARMGSGGKPGTGPWFSGRGVPGLPPERFRQAQLTRRSDRAMARFSRARPRSWLPANRTGFLESVQVKADPVSDWSVSVPAVLGGCVVILAVIALGFYAVGKMRPGSFRVRTSLLRMFSFSMEIESPGAAAPSPGPAAPDRGLTDAEVKVPAQEALGTPSE